MARRFLPVSGPFLFWAGAGGRAHEAAGMGAESACRRTAPGTVVEPEISAQLARARASLGPNVRPVQAGIVEAPCERPSAFVVENPPASIPGGANARAGNMLG